ncbi:MAG: lyase domain protein repeat-containing protein [Labilithrix sp.]|nr:lyase domain protein repeat-containing protein [Labilithrix sp.]
MRPLLDFRKGDSNTPLLAFFTLLGTTAAHTLLETARDALFLARLPASRLAWMILAIAACGLALSRLDRARSQHFSTRPLLLVATGTAAFGVLFHVSAHPGLVIALYLWTGVAASWIVLRFWLALGARFTISDGKRLFGFIGLGSVLGAVAGAGCARALAFVVDARALVLAAGLLFLVTALGPARALARGEGPIRETARERPGAAGYELRADPYAKRILALVLLGTVALTLVDYLFKAAAQAHFQQGELVAFFATASFVMSALALVVQVFGSGWLLRVIGMHRALLVLPVLVVLGGSAFAVTGTLAAALLMKGADGSLRHSLHRTGVELLFLPMADEHRARVKPLVDLVGLRGGQAVASAAILLVAALAAPRAILGVAVVVLGAAWIAVTLDVRRHYLDIFRATLRESHLDPEATRGLESSAAAPALIDLMLDAPEEEVRHRSLRELAHRHAEDPGQRIPEVALSLAADRALRDAFASIEARVVLTRDGCDLQLLATLRERETEATAHLFRVLDLWHPRENFDRVHGGL